jgi:hypothetical protein
MLSHHCSGLESGRKLVNEERLRQEVKEAYEAYLAAFRASDLDKIDSLVKYPFAFIDDGTVRLVDEFPINPAELITKKEWHSTVNADYEVVGVSQNKAHVVLRSAQRLRRDGSPIEKISAFYAYTNTTDGWKLFAISDITVPYI